MNRPRRGVLLLIPAALALATCSHPKPEGPAPVPLPAPISPPPGPVPGPAPSPPSAPAPILEPPPAPEGGGIEPEIAVGLLVGAGKVRLGGETELTALGANGAPVAGAPPSNVWI
ncbi:MAG: hypothetical protein ACREMO_01830, partial [Gemmatimonadales bacterium]